MRLHNWTYIMQNFSSWSMQGYTNALGIFVWPIIFSAVLGYIYLKNQSLIMLAAGILIIMATFINYFVGMEIWINILFILFAMIITGLFLFFFVRRRVP